MTNEEAHDTRADYEQMLEEHDSWFRHSPDEPDHQEMHGKTNPYVIMAFLGATVLGVALTAALVYHSMFLPATRNLQEALLEERTDATWLAAVNEQKAAWEQELSTPAWIDKEAGTVRLPLDVAMNEVVKRYSERKPR